MLRIIARAQSPSYCAIGFRQCNLSNHQGISDACSFLISLVHINLSKKPITNVRLVYTDAPQIRNFRRLLFFEAYQRCLTDTVKGVIFFSKDKGRRNTFRVKEQILEEAIRIAKEVE